MNKRTQDESKIQNALADLESGKIKSVRAAANTYNVPRSTLGDRINGSSRNRHLAYTKDQHLTPTEEGLLVRWITDLYLQGKLPSIQHTQ